MRQAIMTRPGHIEFKDVEIPVPGEREVRLKIVKIGVCGTDVHVWHGKHPFTPYPVVQGHEYSGIVDAIGEKVTSVKPGERATAMPQQVCGKCNPCKRGDYHICDHLKVEGFQAPGCAQDYFVVPEDRIVPFSDSLSFEQGAMIEPVSVAAHSTNWAGSLEGRNVVVLGAGPIGNLVAQAARCRGAEKVLITDLSDFRLQKALECGITASCNVRKEKLSEKAREVFGEKGFDVAFEAVGSEAALDDAVQNIEKGGKIVVLGVFGERPRVDMAVVGDRELKLIGSLMYNHDDYRQAVEWIGSGSIITEKLVTGRFPFSAYEDAYKYIDQHGDESLKLIVDLTQ